MYDKKDATMTRGLAIICMVVLHLFCRVGDDVYGKPLLWLDKDRPFVYLFGFFSEICVPLYALCCGYARLVLQKRSQGDLYRGNLRRIGRLLVNYWAVLVVFSVLGLIFDGGKAIPGTIGDFIKAIFLLKSYNGAWWFLNTYIIPLLIPSGVLLFPVKRLNAYLGAALAFGLHLAYYLAVRFMGNIISYADNDFMFFIYKELDNFIRVLPYFYVGAFACKGDWVTKLYDKGKQLFGSKLKIVALACGVLLFAATNIIHLAASIPFVALATFLLFNVWEKGKVATAFFMFFGKHSTNIWLCHMFFYLTLFDGLAQKAKYPLLMLIFMFALCIAASYTIMGLIKLWGRAFEKIKGAHHEPLCSNRAGQ